MPSEWLNSETRNTSGAIKPCHSPSQNPALSPPPLTPGAPGEIAAAVQPTSSKRAATQPITTRSSRCVDGMGAGRSSEEAMSCLDPADPSTQTGAVDPHLHCLTNPRVPQPIEAVSGHRPTARGAKAPRTRGRPASRCECACASAVSQADGILPRFCNAAVTPPRGRRDARSLISPSSPGPLRPLQGESCSAPVPAPHARPATCADRAHPAAGMPSPPSP